MEDSLSDQEGVYHNVIETLYQTFGEVLTRDIICAIVEGCNGDMDQSANAIMNMTNEMEAESSSPNVENNVEVHQPTLTPRTQSFDHNNSDDSNSVRNVAVNDPQNRKQLGCSQNIEQHCEPHNSSSAGNMAKTNVSYSGVAQSGARPGTYTKNQLSPFPISDLNFWTNQIKQILMHHNKGSRILIIMRGLPGSGKTYLAKKILEATIGGDECDFSTHIFSADDYFFVKGSYRFDKTKLQDAHIWNRSKARSAMNRGVSPVIIDNTNVEPWEMEPYLRDGVNNGYLIEIVEPNTHWAKKANQLSRKNVHNVPLHTIKRMLSNFQDGITAERMMNYYKLSYPNNFIPPVLRNFPVIPIQTVPIELNPNGNVVSSVQYSEHDCNTTQENMTVQNKENICNPSGSSSSDEQMQEITKNNDDLSNTKDAENKQYEFDNNSEQNIESNMHVEELEEIDAAWETNEKWEDDPAENKRTCSKKDVTCENVISENSKPPRNKLNKLRRSLEDTKPDADNLLVECQDWTKIDMFMQPWDDTCKLDEESPLIAVEKVSSGTSMDLSDTDVCNVNKAYKVMSAVSRDINLYYMPLDKEKIPEKRMLDQSSMINEQILEEAFKNEDKKTQFRTFRNVFKNIPKIDLQNVFDICRGDVNWATLIVAEGVANGEFPSVKSEDSSDSDEESICTDDKMSNHVDDVNNKSLINDSKTSTSAKADQMSEETINKIIPYDNSQPSTSAKPDHILENSKYIAILTPRKGKKANTSEHHINLKRQIEKNVVISENHYSKHCLKIRNQRLGIGSEVNSNVNENQENINLDNIELSGNTQSPDGELPSTSNALMEIRTNYNTIGLDNESNSDDFPKSEKTVNINLSWDFISKLDEHFGRDEMIYPEYVTPIVNIPESLLNEINAFWMESYINQSQAKFKETELMIQQDEEIARELERHEFELNGAEEPKTPDFKDLMDNELALSLQNKFNSDWRKEEPMDMAAKLTREKLNNLFPDIHPQVLSELLVAHNNNFNNTVEGLLLSTGQAEILERENGLRDFIMAKGTEHREKMRKERKKELSKSEPLFLAGGEKVDMNLVERFRHQAELHLIRRNQIYQKIRENMSNGNIQVARYYSEIAAMHTQEFDHANSLAVATLIQVGTSKNDYTATMDLHNLRVREAMEGLDLFLDSNIHRLREIQGTSNVQFMTLFFITGRGLHSPGLPRIKPAVQKRLAQRNIAFNERNPGLLMAKVYAGHRMTHEIA
ncbi:NEDD4-binding protein 2-like 2 [Papilio machaon]|uniref:NEDD4-binding protein 2-like 2 n=1 Tax=Papilio machaon TaxID=76193 RepID=A0A194QN22_PAPMA|nr:NEDD4-binding protein 2-like 2 [Papilio machaon]